MESSEATVIESGVSPFFEEPEPERPSAAEVPPAILRVIVGADQGKAFALPLGNGIIGRGANCDVVLADIAVSRRHVAFNFDGENVTLTDQGSGNGTKINGVRVKVQNLAHGDVILVGKTEMQFEWGVQPGGGRSAPMARSAPAPAPAMAQRPAPAPLGHPAGAPVSGVPAGDVPQQFMDQGNLTAQVAPLPPHQAMPAPIPSPTNAGFLGRLLDSRPKKLLVFGGGGVLLLLVVLVIVGALMKPPAKKPAPSAPPAAEGPTPEEVFGQASGLIKERKWAEAAVLLKQLTDYDPTSEVYSKQAAFVDANLKAVELLNRIGEALGEGKLAVAQVRLYEDFAKDKRFLDGGVCKVDEDACSRYRLLEKRYRMIKAAPLIAEARELAQDRRKKKEAIEKIGAALEIVPESYEAQKVRHELDDTPITATPDPEMDKLAAGEALPPEPKSPTVAHHSGASHVGGGVPKSAQTLYAAKDFIGAMAELNSLASKQSGAAASRLQAFAGKVKTVGASLKRGESSMVSDPGTALSEFRKALAADAELGGVHQGLIKGKIFLVARARAGSLFSAGRYGESYQMVVFAQQYGSDGVPRLLDQLSAKAKERFQEGYVIRESNPSRAKEHWRQVLTMVPPTDQWAVKAQQFLKRSSTGTSAVRPSVAPMPAVMRAAMPAAMRAAMPAPKPEMRPPPMRRRYFVGGGDEDEDE